MNKKTFIEPLIKIIELNITAAAAQVTSQFEPQLTPEPTPYTFNSGKVGGDGKFGLSVDMD